MGGYADTFQATPTDWQLDGEKESDGLLDLRADLDPESYAGYVAHWLKAGATVVGGCCGTRPGHILKIRELLPGDLSIAEGRLLWDTAHGGQPCPPV